ncbi:Glycosyltransferase-like KOBITO 1 [Zea mays]|uniref:Glycosyltransferase-like KOBITO 1 n=1 Tax=Zea mays TaxID=4577 RepID=A0A1D6QT64_MAIZE|nr:Glycosyltransferase-like KOBITO 1 [Zea mays]
MVSHSWPQGTRRLYQCSNISESTVENEAVKHGSRKQGGYGHPTERNCWSVHTGRWSREVTGNRKKDLGNGGRPGTGRSNAAEAVPWFARALGTRHCFVMTT